MLKSSVSIQGQQSTSTVKKLPRLCDLPLDIKIRIAEQSDYSGIEVLADTVHRNDQHHLWKHLCQPFEEVFTQKFIQSYFSNSAFQPSDVVSKYHNPRPLSPFHSLCQDGFGSHIVKNLDIVLRHQAASSIMPACASTKLYKELSVPWSTFFGGIVSCKNDVAVSVSRSLMKRDKDGWEQFISAVDRLDRYLSCIDDYSDGRSARENIDSGREETKVVVETYIAVIRELREEWNEGTPAVRLTQKYYQINEITDVYFQTCQAIDE